MTVLSTVSLTEDFSAAMSSSGSPEERDLLRRVRRVLHDQHLTSLRKLNVELEGESVALGGKVSSFYERQMAITCARKTVGTRCIVDRIEVR